MKLLGIVLAAGQGKRMKSRLYKVLHKVCGKPMVEHVVDTLEEMGTDRIVVIVGHGAEAVRNVLSQRVEYALQTEQLGTGHAVLQAEDLIGAEQGVSIVICGDTPLITSASLKRMIEQHQRNQAAASIMTAALPIPYGYGRVIRDGAGKVSRIVEQKDCSPEELLVQEINTGTYCFDNHKLFQALAKVTNRNAQGEYYLTDVISILKQAGNTIEAYCTSDAVEYIGVNDRLALAEAEKFMRDRINNHHMAEGVTLLDPTSTYIDKDVVIGMDTIIYPGALLKGSTVIGEQCVIGAHSEIYDSVIGHRVEVKQSVITSAEIGDDASIGPFAYLRPGAQIGARVKIGDFVEIKNASIGEGSKISHLSYIGDAAVGRDVNIGCGAITVNYDGYNKQRTQIDDGAFIGSNVNLIAPIHIGSNAYIVAGSTITDDVPSGDLAIARERQTNKTGYAEKLRKRIKPN